MKSKENNINFYDAQNINNVDTKDSYSDELGLLSRAKRRRRRELDEEDSWQGDGHYTADGEEWSGWQHAHDGQIMTGKEHDDSSVNLYHFKELDPEVQKKVLAKIQQKDKKEAYEVGTKAYRKYAEKLTPGQGLKETKTIKVGEDSVGAKSTTYALVKERKILALGEKKHMIQASRKQGGRVWLVSGDQTVGDLVESATKKLERRIYIGNCTQEDVVDEIFGNVSEFARQVELHGDDFEIGDFVIKYDEDKDVHHFYRKDVTEEVELDGIESNGEAEEMLARIKQRAADRKASETEERPQSETKIRPATRKILEKRAVRLARALLFKRLSGGKAKSELLFPERLKIERQIAANKKAINKLAVSLYPIIDQKEQERKLPPI